MSSDAFLSSGISVWFLFNCLISLLSLFRVLKVCLYFLQAHWACLQVHFKIHYLKAFSWKLLPDLVLETYFKLLCEIMITWKFFDAYFCAISSRYDRIWCFFFFLVFLIWLLWPCISQDSWQATHVLWFYSHFHYFNLGWYWIPDLLSVC